MADIIGTQWKHWKGNTYTVTGVGRDSETEEIVFVYESSGKLWVRPAKQWFEVVRDGDEFVNRFEELK